MAIKTKLEAVATKLGMDAADVKDSRYHYGHTSGPVWTCGDDYYAATKLNANGTAGKPPTHRNDHMGGPMWNWKKIPDLFIASQGWQVWVASGTAED